MSEKHNLLFLNDSETENFDASSILNMEELPNPLTNVQLELLKLYATDLSDEDIKELKGTLADFYAKKSIRLANHVWEEKGLTNEALLKFNCICCNRDAVPKQQDEEIQRKKKSSMITTRMKSCQQKMKKIRQQSIQKLQVLHPVQKRP